MTITIHPAFIPHITTVKRKKTDKTNFVNEKKERKNGKNERVKGKQYIFLYCCVDTTDTADPVSDIWMFKFYFKTFRFDNSFLTPRANSDKNWFCMNLKWDACVARMEYIAQACMIVLYFIYPNINFQLIFQPRRMILIIWKIMKIKKQPLAVIQWKWI